MVVLGVEKSLSGKKWLNHPVDDRLLGYYVQKYDIPEVLARVLISRHIQEQEVESFLRPTLKNDLPSPFSLKDVQKSAERFVKEITAHNTIGIMGDYDVDGATSSALLHLFLKSVGCQTRVFIPDRDDGYGPNKNKMQEYYDAGIRLVATVDCGTTAFEPIDYGTSLGMDVIADLFDGMYEYICTAENGRWRLFLCD